jgi:serine phosphatase RsbU (regulator of sigma subunit)
MHNAISVPGIDVWISSDPFKGEDRGGDIHYVSMCGEGRISRFALLDVAGHGSAVGELGHRVRALMRKYLNTLDQTACARALNRDLMSLARNGRFATALLTTYFAPTDQLIICNAGHPRPLWYRAAEAAWTPLEPGLSHRSAADNLPLGVTEHASYDQFAVKLDKDDLVLMYTDALIESMSAKGRALGEPGLLALLQGIDVNPAHELSHRLLEVVDGHRGGAPAEDDETLLLLHHNAADPPAAATGRVAHVEPEMVGLSAA